MFMLQRHKHLYEHPLSAHLTCFACVSRNLTHDDPRRAVRGNLTERGAVALTAVS
jgi:hypothetical protein